MPFLYREDDRDFTNSGQETRSPARRRLAVSSVLLAGSIAYSDAIIPWKCRSLLSREQTAGSTPCMRQRCTPGNIAPSRYSLSLLQYAEFDERPRGAGQDRRAFDQGVSRSCTGCGLREGSLRRGTEGGFERQQISSRTAAYEDINAPMIVLLLCVLLSFGTITFAPTTTSLMERCSHRVFDIPRCRSPII